MKNIFLFIGQTLPDINYGLSDAIDILNTPNPKPMFEMEENVKERNLLGNVPNLISGASNLIPGASNLLSGGSNALLGSIINEVMKQIWRFMSSTGLIKNVVKDLTFPVAFGALIGSITTFGVYVGSNAVYLFSNVANSIRKHYMK